MCNGDAQAEEDLLIIPASSKVSNSSFAIANRSGASSRGLATHGWHSITGIECAVPEIEERLQSAVFKCFELRIEKIC